jgi:hypothetical protein
MVSNYPKALEGLQLLINEAQKEHEALASMAGGTANHPLNSWKPNANRTKGEKAEAIAKDVIEAGYIGGLGFGVYKAITTKARENRAARLNSGKVENKVDNFADGDNKINIAKDKPKFLSHQDFTSADFKQFRDHKDIFSDGNEKPVHELSSKVEEIDGPLDQSDIDLFTDLDKEMGSRDIIDRMLDSDITFDNDLKGKVASGGKGESNNDNISAKQEFRADMAEEIDNIDIDPRRLERKVEDGDLIPDNADGLEGWLDGEAAEKLPTNIEFGKDVNRELKLGEEAAQQEIKEETRLIEREAKADVASVVDEEEAAVADMEEFAV